MIWRCGKRILNKVDLPRSVVGEGCRVYLTGGGPKVPVGSEKTCPGSSFGEIHNRLGSWEEVIQLLDDETRRNLLER